MEGASSNPGKRKFNKFEKALRKYPTLPRMLELEFYHAGLKEIAEEDECKIIEVIDLTK